ncbi:MAG: UDP-N-acetylmuramoyl-tripeptide--D-alanyl-D-alanine ligase [Acidiferrobacterales bacterium]
MSLAKAAEVLDSSLQGTDGEFTGVSTDTRTLKSGELFFALQGPNFDGHDYLAEAARRGAIGVVLARSASTLLPCIKVADTRHALGDLAVFWRRQFDVPVLAVTGSNGKTTVKEMIASIMAQTGRGCCTEGNLNNDIGVPLTLLRLHSDDRYAVIELATNRRGEIEYLAEIVAPTIAVITNAAEAHLAGVGSVEDVAREKGALFTALDPRGVAVINADDRHSALWLKLASGRRCLTFGLHRAADVSADYETHNTGNLVRIKTEQGDIEMRLPLLGEHNVSNALAATATTVAAGADLARVKRGLEKLRAVSGRLELKTGINGARVIDDTYNANSASLAAGIAVLKDYPGEKVLVLGDMAELGAAAPDIHRRAGKLAKNLGITRLFALGQLSRLAVESFGKGGKHFPGREALVETLRNDLHADMTVLVKGSRVMQLEEVVQAIVQPASANACAE